MTAIFDGSTRRPTIYDVAERAGVSKSLVSLVLRDSPKVSEPRRTAVLAAIAELGYQPSQAATMLASNRTRSIEVLIDEYRNLSFVGLVEGIRQTLAENNFHLSVTETRQASTRGSMPWSTSADGRILAAEPTDAVLASWSSSPIVVAGHRQSVPAGADVITNDDEHGARLAVGHLIGLGHRGIAHLSGSGGAAHLRRMGYAAAMAGSGLREHIVGAHGGTTEQDGYDGATSVLDGLPEITAFVAANDLMAGGAMAAIREHGRTVPGDISVIGYDDSPLAQSRYLSLTSVDDRSLQVGAEAARVLLARIDHPRTATERLLIEPALVIRTTTGPARPT